MINYSQILDEMPGDLERALGEILSRHVGKEKAVNRDILLQMLQVKLAPEKVDDRKMRLGIENLRNEGVRVCSCYIESEPFPEMGKKRKTRFHKGYFIARTEREYEEFKERYLSYARSIWRTVQAMDKRKRVLTPEGLVEPPVGMETQGQLFAL